MEIVANRNIGFLEVKGEFELFYENETVTIRHKDMADMLKNNKRKIKRKKKKNAIEILKKERNRQDAILCVVKTNKKEKDIP